MPWFYGHVLENGDEYLEHTGGFFWRDHETTESRWCIKLVQRLGLIRQIDLLALTVSLCYGMAPRNAAVRKREISVSRLRNVTWAYLFFGG